MKKAVLFIILIGSLHSCAFDKKGFEFDNFKNTPLWELAKAVKDNDADLIKELMKSNKLYIDFKEPINQQTLLTLAIVNEKKEAFMILLNMGANPNMLLGTNKNSTPLTESILNQKDCDLFYIENLLKNGANPNLEIIPEDKENYFFYNYPLFAAITKHDKNSNECINTVKLLVEYNADINCCHPRPLNEDVCEGVIEACLTIRSMENLRYFVIEKKIKIPKIVYIIGEIDKATQKEYSLTEILNTNDYKFEDFEDELGKHTFKREREIKKEILEYLKKTRKE